MNKLDFEQHPDKTETCEIHGEYASKNVFRNIWTRCPVCQEIAKNEDEEMERQKEAEAIRQRWESKVRAACIPERFKDRTLENYIVANKDQETALSICKQYSDDFADVMERGSNLILCGKPGTGKTHLAIGIAIKAMQEHGILAVFSTVMRAVRRIKSTWVNDSEETESKAIRAFTKPGLLILDEIGVQFGSETEENLLFDIINERYENRRPTIAISNLDKDGVKKYLGERAYDRFREDGGRLINFTWDSYRSKNR